jgi:hypothetical protein
MRELATTGAGAAVTHVSGQHAAYPASGLLKE